MSHYSRRRTYEGLGDTDSLDRDSDRIVRTVIIPERKGGVVKARGFKTVPINRAMSFLRSRRWKLAAGRMTFGGTSPFFGSKYLGIDAKITSAITQPPFVNNIVLEFDKVISAGDKKFWDVFINGISVNIGGVQFSGNSKKILTIGGLPTILAGEVITISHVLPGQGIPIITKFPVDNQHV